MNKKRREKDLKGDNDDEAGVDVQIEGLDEERHKSDSDDSD